MYLHWDFFASELCKRGILKILLLRAHILCSNQYLLEKEIKNLEHVFRKIIRLSNVGGKKDYSEISYETFSNRI